MTDPNYDSNLIAGVASLARAALSAPNWRQAASTSAFPDEAVASWIWIGAPISTDPSFQAVSSALAADDWLRNLIVPGPKLKTLIVGEFGTGLTEASLATGLIQGVAREILFLHGGDAGVAEDVAKRQLAALREMASGQQFKGHMITGFAGPKLSPDRPLNTPWGALRAVHSSHVSAMGQRSTTAILATPCLVKAQIHEPDSGAPTVPDQGFLEARRQLSVALELLPLAFAFSSKDQRQMPIYLWNSVLCPSNQGMRSNFYPVGFDATTVIADHEALEIERWSKLLADHHVPALSVAVQRLVSAITQDEPEDRLIDAVIAWENICGARPETTFRVTAALAKLTTTDPLQREQVQRHLAEIYGIRSDVVHGRMPSAKELASASSAAVDVAVRAIRIVYSERTDLIGMSSTQRVSQLLLRDP